MLEVFSADSRFFEDYDWIQLHSLFSFNQHYDPNNMNFGAAILFNDYTVKPGQGFPPHPHDSHEQIFIVLDGQFTMRDCLGGSDLLNAGGVKCIISGTGFSGSTVNTGATPARYIGIWMLSRDNLQPPSCLARQFSSTDWHNVLFPIVSDRPHPQNDINKEPLPFSSFGTLYRCALERSSLEHTPDSLGLVYVLSGTLFINGTRVNMKEHVRISHETHLHIQAENADFLYLDMPEIKEPFSKYR